MTNFARGPQGVFPGRRSCASSAAAEVWSPPPSGGARWDARDLSRATWRKSSYSNGGGNCVEVADLSDGARKRYETPRTTDDGVLPSSIAKRGGRS